MVKKLSKQLSMTVAYVYNALSFIFIESTLASRIRQVYLYGSAVREGLTAESDIDIFIDCAVQDEKIIEPGVKAALNRFYQSTDFKKWPYLQGTYPITIHAGELEHWELKKSIESEGILLYSKTVSGRGGKRSILFHFILPKNKKNYLSFIRTLFGRKEKGYKEHGLLKNLEGKKLSATVVLIPQENQQKIISFLNKERIDYSMKEIVVFD